MKKVSRKKWLQGAARGGVLAGIVGLGYVLNSREEKFECSDRCGPCKKNKSGVCTLGLK